MIAAADFRFQPHEDRGSVRAFIFAVVMHCLLIAFLYFGISWTNQPAAPAQADLWTALPPMSSPPPRVVTPPQPRPEPKIEEPKPEPPPPVKADITQKIEKKKPEPPKKKEPPKEPPKKEPPKAEPKTEPPPKPVPKPPEKQQPDPVKAEMDRMQRQLNQDTARNDMQRQLAQEGKQKAQAAASSGNSDAWNAKFAGLVRSGIPVTIANAVKGNSPAIFDITVLPGREVGLVRLVTSSGNPAFDAAAQQAIQATTPLPLPTPGMAPISGHINFKAFPKDQ